MAVRMVVTRGALLLLSLLLLTAAAPRAEAQSKTDELTPSYLFDGGAIPFLYGSVVATLALERWVETPSRPRFFSASEGGARSRIDEELPSIVITAGSVVTGAAIGLSDDPSRWFHLKGFAESLATTSLFTVAGKLLVGRHRPDYDPDNGLSDTKSFPSGHSSAGLATITYAALYLRTHGFDRYRPKGTLPWWEVATYGGLAALAIAIPSERVYHNRHHATDALAGALLGTGMSVAFFTWQERRYQKARRGEVEPSWLQLGPTYDRLGVQLSGSF
jgi:membrane-associated phospholipid phosphatase